MRCSRSTSGRWRTWARTCRRCSSGLRPTRPAGSRSSPVLIGDPAASGGAPTFAAPEPAARALARAWQHRSWRDTAPSRSPLRPACATPKPRRSPRAHSAPVTGGSGRRRSRRCCRATGSRRSRSSVAATPAAAGRAAVEPRVARRGEGRRLDARPQRRHRSGQDGSSQRGRGAPGRRRGARGGAARWPRAHRRARAADGIAWCRAAGRRRPRPALRGGRRLWRRRLARRSGRWRGGPPGAALCARRRRAREVADRGAPHLARRSLRGRRRRRPAARRRHSRTRIRRSPSSTSIRSWRRPTG